MNADVSRWINRQAELSRLRVVRICMDQCEQWSLHDGRLVHSSGGFFSIYGALVSSSLAHLDGLVMPLIDQPEVGILGFLVRQTADGWQWLLQAKSEPGSVGGTQVGPTVQATRSNWLCRHGGKATAFLDYFLSPSPESVIVDVLHSEQGDRFIGKYNRNLVVQIDSSFRMAEDSRWTWCSAEKLRSALKEDFLINTDSRSVLWSSDLRLLMSPGFVLPFERTRAADAFADSLYRSLHSDPEHLESSTQLSQAMVLLEASRSRNRISLAPFSLVDLPGWAADGSGIVPSDDGSSYGLSFVSVQAADREVGDWCQPLIESKGTQKIVLFCAAREQVMYFALALSAEPGFREVVQYGPSYVSGPGHPVHPFWASLLTDSATKTHAVTFQSDEGGRFLNSVAEYKIVEIPDSLMDDPAIDCLWVTLSTLRRMSVMEGVVNNELRSVLSMLLAWV